MHINLRCEGCDEVSPTSYGQMYSIWKEGYDKMPDEKKKEVQITAEVQCICGHRNKFSSPMFQHTFGVVFHELLSLED